MNKPNMPANVRKAMKIIRKAQAKTKDGWVSAEEHKRICAKLQKLGVHVVMEEPSAEPKKAAVEDVQIHPWKEDATGNRFNPWCSNAQGVDAGWNVHSFAPDDWAAARSSMMLTSTITKAQWPTAKHSRRSMACPSAAAPSS